MDQTEIRKRIAEHSKELIRSEYGRNTDFLATLGEDCGISESSLSRLTTGRFSKPPAKAFEAVRQAFKDEPPPGFLSWEAAIQALSESVNAGRQARVATGYRWEDLSDAQVDSALARFARVSKRFDEGWKVPKLPVASHDRQDELGSDSTSPWTSVPVEEARSLLKECGLLETARAVKFPMDDSELDDLRKDLLPTAKDGSSPLACVLADAYSDSPSDPAQASQMQQAFDEVLHYLPAYDLRNRPLPKSFDLLLVHGGPFIDMRDTARSVLDLVARQPKDPQVVIFGETSYWLDANLIEPVVPESWALRMYLERELDYRFDLVLPHEGAEPEDYPNPAVKSSPRSLAQAGPILRVDVGRAIKMSEPAPVEVGVISSPMIIRRVMHMLRVATLGWGDRLSVHALPSTERLFDGSLRQLDVEARRQQITRITTEVLKALGGRATGEF